MININRQKYLKLKKTVKDAKNSLSLTFEGNFLDTSFAKYLLKYLSGIYETNKTS